MAFVISGHEIVKNLINKKDQEWNDQLADNSIELVNYEGESISCNGAMDDEGNDYNLSIEVGDLVIMDGDNVAGCLKM